MPTLQRFHLMWGALGAKEDADALFAELLQAYSEPHRAYHNVQHLADCLEQLKTAADLAEDPAAVEAALWFHDAVYDPHAADNEEKSADWARRALERGTVEDVRIHRIVDMILSTKHRVEPVTADPALVVDIDLSILGREPEVFAAYDRRIREEFAWVPEEQYRSGRRAILAGFLARPFIYRTLFFRARFETQARVNLKVAIAKLSSRGVL